MDTIDNLDWSKTSLDDLAKTESEHYDTAKKLLAEELPLFYEMRSLFHSDGELKITDDTYLQVRLLFDSAKFFDYCALTLMRSHLSEAMFELRRSVEAAAFAFKMKDPEVQKTWLNKNYEDKDFQRQLRSRKWVGCGSLIQLESFWRMGSDFGGHAGIKSQVYRHDRKGDKIKHGYFDMKEPQSYYIRSYFNYLLKGNSFIIETYSNALGKVFSDDWRNRLFEIQGRLNKYQHGRLKEWLDKASPYRKKEATYGGLIIPKPGDVIKLLLSKP